MAVNINTIYQRVLALTNKEQRGYITPQEFNLFANQAQQEIFEQYFYDLNQAARIPGNEYVFADVDDMLEEKIQIFEMDDDAVTVGGYANAAGSLTNKVLPLYIYRVHGVDLNNIPCDLLKTKDFNEVRYGGLLTQPTTLRPVANIRNNIMRVIGDNNTSFVPTRIYHSRRPNNVRWAYVIVNKKALHDPTFTIDFELHDSEESELVYKILKFAGVSMKREEVTRAALGAEMMQIQQEKQ